MKIDLWKIQMTLPKFPVKCHDCGTVIGWSCYQLYCTCYCNLCAWNYAQITDLIHQHNKHIHLSEQAFISIRNVSVRSEEEARWMRSRVYQFCQKMWRRTGHLSREQR